MKTCRGAAPCDALEQARYTTLTPPSLPSQPSRIMHPPPKNKNSTAQTVLSFPDCDDHVHVKSSMTRMVAGSVYQTVYVRVCIYMYTYVYVYIYTSTVHIHTRVKNRTKMRSHTPSVSRNYAVYVLIRPPLDLWWAHTPADLSI